MAYADVDLIIDGALDESTTVSSTAQLSRLVAKWDKECKSAKVRGEVRVLWHGHPMSDEDCVCAQYEVDHHPHCYVGIEKESEEES